MQILVTIDTPHGFDRSAQKLASGAKIVHARPDDDAYENGVKEAEVILGWPRARDLRTARNLRWLQLSSAGADSYLADVPEHVSMTTANGVHGIPVAEHAFALMLAFARGIHASVRKQMRHHWETMDLDELYGRTCGILGLGDIGTELAKRASAFGMRVLAMKRSPASPPPYVERLLTMDELHILLRESDYMVSTLPHTPATAGLLNAETLAEMKPGSYLINVGRGSAVDEAALVSALRSGMLNGAGLDVFEEEPLPPESPLWEMANVIITSHEAGQTPRLGERVAELFLKNLARYVDGELLINTVDRELGY